MNKGFLAVAFVQSQVTIVRSARAHDYRDNWIDVHIFRSLGNRVFVSPVLQGTPTPTTARISSHDLLTIFPDGGASHSCSDSTMLELGPEAYSEFVELSSRNLETMDFMWNQLQSNQKSGTRLAARSR